VGSSLGGLPGEIRRAVPRGASTDARTSSRPPLAKLIVSDGSPSLPPEASVAEQAVAASRATSIASLTPNEVMNVGLSRRRPAANRNKPSNMVSSELPTMEPIANATTTAPISKTKISVDDTIAYRAYCRRTSSTFGSTALSSFSSASRNLKKDSRPHIRFGPIGMKRTVS
jgi:hypothetical protein